MGGEHLDVILLTPAAHKYPAAASKKLAAKSLFFVSAERAAAKTVFRPTLRATPYSLRAGIWRLEFGLHTLDPDRRIWLAAPASAAAPSGSHNFRLRSNRSERIFEVTLSTNTLHSNSRNGCKFV